MDTVMQCKAQSNGERTPRWSRTQRAELFEQYLDLSAQGLSLRQAAKVLEVPRRTLQPGGPTKRASTLILPS